MDIITPTLLSACKLKRALPTLLFAQKTIMERERFTPFYKYFGK
jgi:hypothetical protein